MTLRTYRLHRDGGGWNPALYPALLRVLDTYRPRGRAAPADGSR
jgi:hypothetical protein